MKNYPLTLLTFFRSALKRQHLTKSMEEKRNVLFRIYKKNQYASQKTPTYYASSGFMDDVVMPFDSKIIMPLAYNKIRTYIAGQIYDANDTKETINKNSMVITVDADNQVLISAFDSENGLKVEMLSPEF